MRFRVLGPVTVAPDAGEELAIPRAKLRVLLAILLARPNTVVPTDLLIDCLWGSRPVRSARSNLKTYIWGLRQTIVPSGMADAPISTAPHGYAIWVDPQSLDALAFDRLVGDADRAREAGDLTLAAQRLQASLALWRGTAFEDIPATVEILAGTIRRLEEQRVAAVEALFDVQIAAGHHTTVIGELHARIAEHPLRERLWEQLMLALYRDGRQADALDAYRRLRQRLVEDIGVEPGAPVQALQSRILAADPVLAAVPARTGEVIRIDDAGRIQPDVTPRQLPHDVATFVGREHELNTLQGWLAGDRDGAPRPVVVIHGPPGIGKSALAVRAATAVSADYPDGQLYVNLHGATPDVAALSPAEALRRFLRALGITAAAIPSDVEESAALFRTLMADRRALVVLDNAASTAQVRHLLPGGVGNAVLVTSRATLAVLDGSMALRLVPLPPEASEAMLCKLLGDARVIAEPNAIRRLAEVCDHLPLGLHVAAARLKARPGWTVQHLVDRLLDERHRLSELSAGEIAVRSSFNVSYRALEHSDDSVDRLAAHAFRRFTALRVTHVSLDLAAAMLRTSSAEAGRIVERLVDAHLIEAVKPDRYDLHDLVRLFAAELAAERTPPDELAAAAAGGLSYLLAMTRHASRLAYPHRIHPPVPVVSGIPPAFVDARQARGWLEEQRGNLVSVALQALDGRPERARMGIWLTLSLHWFFTHAGNAWDAIRLNEQALTMARRLGERRAEAHIHDTLGWALSVTGRLSDARAHLLESLSISRNLGDRFGQQRALGNLGIIALTLGRPDEAIPLLEHQIQVAHEIGTKVDEAFGAVCLGCAYRLLGQPEEAIGRLAAALTWCERSRDDYVSSGALEQLGLVYLALGDPWRAIRLLEVSLEQAHRAGHRLGEASALVGLIRTWRRLGATDKALDYAHTAATLAETVDGPRIRTAIRATYAGLLAEAS